MKSTVSTLPLISFNDQGIAISCHSLSNNTFPLFVNWFSLMLQLWRIMLHHKLSFFSANCRCYPNHLSIWFCAKLLQFVYEYKRFERPPPHLALIRKRYDMTLFAVFQQIWLYWRKIIPCGYTWKMYIRQNGFRFSSSHIKLSRLN